jgi:hypothetical protein
MDPVANPFAPGAGAPPPELAGRDALVEKASIALQRLARGNFARSLILTGLRGVGKTALLNKIRQDADAQGFVTIRLEAAEGRSLPSLVAPGLRTALLKLDHMKAASEGAKRALRVLAGFVGAMKLTYHDVELKMDVPPEPGVGDAARLDESLAQLLVAVGEAAREKATVVVLFIDELHVVPPAELAALIMALHIAAQDLLPVTLVAAGLPQIPARMGEAKTYAERLFEFPRIDRLDRDAARLAILKPAADRGVIFTEAAFDEIFRETHGYAYFLQEWGKHAWDFAEASPIDADDVRGCGPIATAALDESFFSVRFGQLTGPQKLYLRAMAELGAGPHRSGDVAAAMGKKVTSVAVTREQLIAKGMVYSPIHGETAFTVPMFDAFLKRVLPELDPAAKPL